MLSNDQLIILCITLLVILVLIGVYGVIGYKIYLKKNMQQLNSVIANYETMISQHLECMSKYEELTKQSTEHMVCFIVHLEELKKQKNR